MIEARFQHELREGIEVAPHAGVLPADTAYWLALANNPRATQLQRVSAVIILFQTGYDLTIEVKHG